MGGAHDPQSFLDPLNFNLYDTQSPYLSTATLRFAAKNPKYLKCGMCYIKKNDPIGSFNLLGDNAFLSKGANSLRTDFHRNLLAVDFKSLLLEVRLPYLFGVALRKADVAAKLLALASDFTLLHC